LKQQRRGNEAILCSQTIDFSVTDGKLFQFRLTYCRIMIRQNQEGIDRAFPRAWRRFHALHQITLLTFIAKRVKSPAHRRHRTSVQFDLSPRTVRLTIPRVHLSISRDRLTRMPWSANLISTALTATGISLRHASASIFFLLHVYVQRQNRRKTRGRWISSVKCEGFH